MNPVQVTQQGMEDPGRVWCCFSGVWDLQLLFSQILLSSGALSTSILWLLKDGLLLYYHRTVPHVAIYIKVNTEQSRKFYSSSHIRYISDAYVAVGTACYCTWPWRHKILYHRKIYRTQLKNSSHLFYIKHVNLPFSMQYLPVSAVNTSTMTKVSLLLWCHWTGPRMVSPESKCKLVTDHSWL